MSRMPSPALAKTLASVVRTSSGSCTRADRARRHRFARSLDIARVPFAEDPGTRGEIMSGAGPGHPPTFRRHLHGYWSSARSGAPTHGSISQSEPPAMGRGPGHQSSCTFGPARFGKTHPSRSATGLLSRAATCPVRACFRASARKRQHRDRFLKRQGPIGSINHVKYLSLQCFRSECGSLRDWNCVPVLVQGKDGGFATSEEFLCHV